MQHRGRAHHNKLAQISVAHLRDAPEALLAAARTLARREPEKGGELASAGKDAASPTVVTTAVAINGATPGIVINRRAFSSALTISMSVSSIAAIA